MTTSTPTDTVWPIGIDFGGTGIKAAPVDLVTGEFAREHEGEITPQEARDRAVLLLSRLVGAMALARAVRHVQPELSDEILRTCHAHALD